MSSDERAPQSNFLPTDTRAVILVSLMVSLISAVVLAWLGQPFWCECGRWQLASWDIWSAHNSQHPVDPYTFTHVLHGILFCGFLWMIGSRFSVIVRYSTAMVAEGLWEVLENTPLVIDRYREATISMDYYGDSIANSVFDILACGLGFLVAQFLGLRWSVAVFVLVEAVLAWAIRDNLTLNVIMLVCPLESIKQWQMPP